MEGSALLRMLCLWTAVLSPSAVLANRNIYEIIESDPDLSDFYNLIQKSEVVKAALRYSEMTVFAPTNEAFRKYKGVTPQNYNLLAYHLVKTSITSDRFPVAATTELAGGLPLWVSKHYIRHGITPEANYYANNGQIIRMDIKGISMEGSAQVLHVVDEVLEPTLPQNDDPNFRNPSAYRILTNPVTYKVTEQFSEFEQKVNQFRKQMVFQGGEGHTFFLPVDGNNNPDTWGRIDDKVIDGHVIPDKVYFSKAFPHEAQETMSFNDNIKVVVNLKNESTYDGRQFELSVQSNTVVGQPSYPRGTVVARIVKANIPVKNGVVHLIENPLIVINKNLFQLLQQNSQLRQFYDVLQRHGGDILNRITQYDATLFAPTNEAFQSVDPTRLNVVLNDERSVRQMLNLHVVPYKLTTEEVFQGTSVAQTLDQTRKLHFRRTYHNVTVVGGGVNATITTADVGALNGIIQVIDKVLGIPYNTIYDKLSSDSSLSSSFQLGTQQNFNEQFREFQRVFTYFVPHNDAWNKIQTRYPSEYYKLFSRQYVYNVEKLLNRHLIVNQEYSLQDLLRIGGSITTVNGKIDVFESNGRYYLRCDGETSEILDADVETNNGKVHVIRDVLFKQSDLTTGQAPAAPFLSLFTLLFTFLLVNIII